MVPVTLMPGRAFGRALALIALPAAPLAAQSADSIGLDIMARLCPGAYSRILRQPIERFLDRVFATDGWEKE
jgi:hypothetical protein